jgi:hypothetical protein
MLGGDRSPIPVPARAALAQFPDSELAAPVCPFQSQKPWRARPQSSGSEVTVGLLWWGVVGRLGSPAPSRSESLQVAPSRSESLRVAQSRSEALVLPPPPRRPPGPPQRQPDGHWLGVCSANVVSSCVAAHEICPPLCSRSEGSRNPKSAAAPRQARDSGGRWQLGAGGGPVGHRVKGGGYLLVDSLDMKVQVLNCIAAGGIAYDIVAQRALQGELLQETSGGQTQQAHTGGSSGRHSGGSSTRWKWSRLAGWLSTK